jgi:hypothetical protein
LWQSTEDQHGKSDASRSKYRETVKHVRIEQLETGGTAHEKGPSRGDEELLLDPVGRIRVGVLLAGGVQQQYGQG